MLDSRLKNRDGVEVTFHDYSSTAVMGRLSRPVEVEQNRTLVKQRSFGTIEVFWLCFGVDRPSTKGNYASLVIVYWYHNSITKTVVRFPTAVGIDEEPALNKQSLAKPLASQS